MPQPLRGTSSDAGKSIINAGFCRILKQDGYSPAPYKAQNMSLNSYATPEGYEIGRAQATQAEACGIPCHSDMNPVLLKPTGEKMSQVVLNGKPIGNRSAYEYFRSNDNSYLFDAAHAAFERLNQLYAPIVLEGAGSISELNLKNRDIVNMSMAKRVNAAVYLISDIERGGVFGSVYGSIQLLPPDERALVKGIIINKFRGDSVLFDEGKKILEELTGIPVTGIIPYLKDVYIEDEDSVVLGKKPSSARTGKVNICVVKMSYMANFTDFNALEFDERVHLYYSQEITQIEQADIVILPGSKNTLADLTEIHQNGVATAVLKAYQNNKTVIGVCGGYQMMGERVLDPLSIEGSIPEVAGLNLLPVETTMGTEKLTVQAQFRFLDNDAVCEGYELHMGITTPTRVVKPLNVRTDGSTEGVYINQTCWGSYFHGILDNKVVIDHLLAPYTPLKSNRPDYRTFKDGEYDKLAAHLREHLDINAMYQQMLQTN